MKGKIKIKTRVARMKGEMGGEKTLNINKF